MRVLLDECVPRRLRTQLAGHDVRTVPEASWAGIKSGRLLAAAAAAEFACFITVDRNLQFQQRPGSLPMAVILLTAPNNKFETLQLAMESVRTALAALQPGSLVVVHV